MGDRLKTIDDRLKTQDDRLKTMGEWANGRMGEWANGRMGEWANGRMGEWANGRMGEWAMGGGYDGEEFIMRRGCHNSWSGGFSVGWRGWVAYAMGEQDGSR
jgi:hypothetical protein